MRTKLFVDVQGAAQMVGVTPDHFTDRIAERYGIRVLKFDTGNRPKAKQFFLVSEVERAKREMKRADSR